MLTSGFLFSDSVKFQWMTFITSLIVLGTSKSPVWLPTWTKSWTFCASYSEFSTSAPRSLVLKASRLDWNRPGCQLALCLVNEWSPIIDWEALSALSVVVIRVHQVRACQLRRWPMPQHTGSHAGSEMSCEPWANYSREYTYSVLSHVKWLYDALRSLTQENLRGKSSTLDLHILSNFVVKRLRFILSCLWNPSKTKQNALHLHPRNIHHQLPQPERMKAKKRSTS